MPSTEKDYLTKPFRVLHENGDVVAGFNTLEDAQENAKGRNVKAELLGIAARYEAKPKG